MNQKEREIYGLDQELRNRLDFITDRILKEPSGAEADVFPELMRTLCLGGEYREGAFYVFERLTDGFSDRSCQSDAPLPIRRMLDQLRTLLWSAPLMELTAPVRECFFENLYRQSCSWIQWSWDGEEMPCGDDRLPEWLLTYGDSKLYGEYDKMLFFHELALACVRGGSSPSPLKIAKCWLRLSTDFTFLHQYEYQIAYARKALDMLEGLEEEPDRERKLLTAEAWRKLGVGYNADFEHPENNLPDESLDCYRRAIEIFDEVLGEGNERTKLVEQNIAVLKADLKADAGEQIGILKKQIKEERKKEQPDQEKIADNYKLIADLYAEGMDNYKKAIHYYEYYLKWAKNTYGEESDYAADCYEELAEYYEAGGDLERAGEYYDRALWINVREMGRIYLLPPLFKEVLVGILTKTGRIDEDDKFTRSMSASDSYLHVGKIWLESGQAVKAIKAFEKALELREWVLQEPTYEKGYIHQKMSEAYGKLQEPEKAEKELDAALEIFQETFRKNMENGNPSLLASETEECRKEILMIRKQRGLYMEWEQVKEIIEEIKLRTGTEAYSLVINPEKTPDIFDSKFGGLPYWDMEKEYPRDSNGNPLMLLAQINLDRAEVRSPLPEKGMLQFFTGPDDVYGMDFDAPDRQDTFRVVYHEEINCHITREQVLAGGLPIVNTDKENEEYTPVLREAAVDIVKKTAYMGDQSWGFSRLFKDIAKEKFGNDLENESVYNAMDQKSYSKMTEELSNAGHWLLGYPYFTQYDPREEKEKYQYYDTLLFQMDSDYIDGEDYVMWGDCGVGNFFINREDLKKRDFSKVLYNWDCC